MTTGLNDLCWCDRRLGALDRLWLVWPLLLLATILHVQASPVFTVLPSGHKGFDVYADGVLAAPIRLAANDAIVADQVETNASGVRLSALRARDSAAVTFAPDDFVSITLPATGATNPPVVWEPTVE